MTRPLNYPPQGAHHLDLMFSNEADPPSVVEVRKQERAWMERWIKEATGGKPAVSMTIPGGKHSVEAPCHDDGLRKGEIRSSRPSLSFREWLMRPLSGQKKPWWKLW